MLSADIELWCDALPPDDQYVVYLAGESAESPNDPYRYAPRTPSRARRGGGGGR